MTYAFGARVQSTPVLRSTNAELFSGTVHQYLRTTELHFAKPESFEGHAQLFRLADLRLASLGASAPAMVAVSEVGDFRQAFVRGDRIATRLDGRDTGYHPGDPLITAPGQRRTYDFGGKFTQNLITLDPVAVDRKLTALLGQRPGRKIEFAPKSDFSRAHNHQLQGLMDFFTQHLTGNQPLPPTLQQQMEETIVVAFLTANEHNYSRYLHEDAVSASPRIVRRAEEYIEANWDRSVGIEELAEVTNTSARSLFRAFRQTRSYSPGTFAKIVRLHYARAALQSADAETTVSAIAFRFGFLNQAQFTANFRKVFGEHPLTVVKDARRRRQQH